MMKIEDFLYKCFESKLEVPYNITVMSKKNLLDFALKSHKAVYAVISIRDIDDKFDIPSNSRNGIKLIHKAFFNDVNESEKYHFIKKDADAIYKFIEKVKMNNIHNIIVHCHAGVSRSSATAAATMMYLNGNDMDIWDSPKYRPNILVYTTLMKRYFNKIDLKEIERKRIHNMKLWESHMYEIRSTLTRQEDLDRWNKIWNQFSHE